MYNLLQTTYLYKNQDKKSNNDTKVNNKVDTMKTISSTSEKIDRNHFVNRRTTNKNESSSSGNGQQRQNLIEVKDEIKYLIKKYSPNLVNNIDRMLIDYSGKEYELLLRLKIEFNDHDQFSNNNETHHMEKEKSYSDKEIRDFGNNSNIININNNNTNKPYNKSNMNGGNIPVPISKDSKTVNNLRKLSHRDSEMLENARWEVRKEIQKRTEMRLKSN